MNAIATRRLVSPMFEAELAFEGDGHLEAPGGARGSRPREKIVRTFVRIERDVIAALLERMRGE